MQILLLLQNRGRLTSVQLAAELEVTPRTILRDVDAMTEAGLPIIVFQGNQGGIELGFNYRTRLTGLDQDEAEALGVILGSADTALATLGMDQAAWRARAKLVESFPDKVRETVQRGMRQFNIDSGQSDNDPRIPAFAAAIRGRRIVRINANRKARTIHPVGMGLTQKGWQIKDDLSASDIPLQECGDINISAHTFA
ncbi:helix-turn-helix transcriptional regulator [Yoonia sp. 2307UL14-13]|uniref:helix-turn-helix transcriptional regulator n=1 Tax=Yoonia sp. 2307UL14-13 TaxID=3126506 RepID=UPI0030EF5418